MACFRRARGALSALCWIFSFLLISTPVVAVPADPAEDAQSQRGLAGESAIRDALERNVTISFDNQSFADVIKWLKQTERLNVAIDGEHVDGESELSELAVTFSAQDLPLGITLKRLLAGVDLAFEIRDDVLLITTHDHESSAEIRAYDVRDLVATPGPFEDAEFDCRPLITALTCTVARGHWTEYGADTAGALRGTLLVSQTAAAHERIEQCLAALRQARERQAKRPGGESIRVEHADTAKVQASIRRKLEKPATLRFSEMPLADALGTLRDAQDLPIELDNAAMHEVGEPNDLKVSLDIHDLPLRSALKRMLSRMDLAFVIREQSVLVTTGERAADSMRTVVYPVRDLIDDATAADGGDDVDAFESLSRAILAVVAPRTWELQGGSGELCPVPGAYAFVCLQADQAHGELEQLLKALRAAHDKQPADAAAKPLSSYHTKIYRLQPSTLNGERTAADLPRFITERIDPKSWQGTNVFVSAVGDQLVVRQTPAVQRQIIRLLRQMDWLAAPQATSPASADETADPLGIVPGVAPEAKAN